MVGMRRSWPLLLLIALLNCFLIEGQTSTGRVTLTVVDSSSKRPVKNAIVTLQRLANSARSLYPDPSASSLTISSKEDGTVEFLQIAPGRYFVSSIDAQGYVFDRPDMASPSFTPILVTQSEDIKIGSVGIIPKGVIKGTVTDEFARPIVGATVTALAYGVSISGVRELRAGARATTDDLGQYRIHDLRPGLYFVRASGQSRLLPLTSGASTKDSVFAPVYYPNAEAPSSAVRLDIPPGGDVRIDLWLRQVSAFHIRGNISGVPGGSERTLINVVSCPRGYKEDAALVTAAIVRPDASFDVGGIPPGSYCVTFQKAADGGDVVSFGSEVITITNRDIEVRLVASPTLEISGTVTLDERASLPMPTSVSLLPASQIAARVLKGTVDKATGAFRVVGVLPVSYKLTVPLPAGGYIKSMKLGNQDIADGIVTAHSGAGVLAIEIGVARGDLKGKVSAGLGRRIEGIRVTLAPDGPLSKRADLIRTAYTNESGEFEVTDLAPGSYKILPWEKVESELIQLPEFLSLFSATSARVVDGEQTNVQASVISANDIEAVKGRF